MSKAILRRPGIVIAGLCMLATSLLAQQPATPVPPPVSPSIDVTETGLLLRNLLKDAAKHTDTEAQYRLYMRAKGVYTQLEPFITTEQQKTYRTATSRVFKGLRLPRTVVTDLGLTFTLRRSGNTRFYWCEAVNKGAFTAFVNAAEVGEKDLAKWFHERPFKFNERGKRYFAADADQPISGGSFYAAKSLATWLSRRDRVNYVIPSAEMVPSSSKLSFWTDAKWSDNKQLERMQNLRMFGGQFQVLVLDGKPIGEFPEAAVAGVTFHYVISVSAGKRLYLKQLSATQP